MFKFNILCEKITSNLLQEGRTRKSEKYSNIEIDSSAFNEKLKQGDLDELIKVWSSKSWMGGLPEDKLKDILNNISDQLLETPPSAYTDLIGTVESKVSEATNRKDLRVKITRVITNLLTDESYGLTKITASPAPKEVTQTVSQAAQSRKEFEKNQDALSPIEQRIYDRVASTDDRQESANVIRQELAEDPDTEDMTDEQIKDVIISLVDKGKLKRDGNTLSLPEEPASLGTSLLDIDDEDSEVNPLDYDSDVEAAYKEYEKTKDISDNY
jgi:hypothetical protein